MKQSGQPRSRRILVVDDDEPVRAFALAGAGYEVVVASDSREALAMADTQGPFDLFVIDLVTPRINGDDLARILRHADPDLKVLYFTANGDRLCRQTAALSVNEAFLDKPLSIAALLEAVSLLLFGHTQGPSERTTHPRRPRKARLK